jgi:PIN domain nuclease of toxin-antitoxin system
VSQPDIVEVQPAYVLDTSAFLAFLHGEVGADTVRPLLSRSVISSVNWAEVLQKVIARGSREVRDVREDLASLGLQVLPFAAEDAESTALLWPSTRRAGLSLGDRACLSLAQKLGLPALTADRGWAALGLEVEVRLIR